MSKLTSSFIFALGFVICVYLVSIFLVVTSTSLPFSTESFRTLFGYLWYLIFKTMYDVFYTIIPSIIAFFLFLFELFMIYIGEEILDVALSIIGSGYQYVEPDISFIINFSKDFASWFLALSVWGEEMQLFTIQALEG